MSFDLGFCGGAFSAIGREGPQFDRSDLPSERRAYVEMAWTVIATRSNYERKVRSELARLGIKCYLPEYWGSKRRLVLFPGYVFVWIPKVAWQAIVRTRGVLRVFLFGEKLAQLARGYIESLKEQENENGCIELGRVRWERGQRLRVLQGAFMNQIALFEKAKARMVTATISLLGRQHDICLPREAFALAVAE